MTAAPVYGPNDCRGRKPGRGHHFVMSGGAYRCAFCPRRIADPGPPDTDLEWSDRGLDFGDAPWLEPPDDFFKQES